MLLDPSCKAEGFDGDLAGFVSSLQKPRKILIMATAGKVVDTIIDSPASMDGGGGLDYRCW